MSGLLTRIRNNSFIKHVITLMTGTVIAQIIPFVAAPFLSRIYSPEDFGRLALYLSVIQILGVISNGRYELAIALPEEKEKGVKITILCIIISLLMSVISLILILLFADEVAILLGDKLLSKWLYFVPISILMMGLFNGLNYYNIREKEFKNIAKATILKASGGNLLQLIFGLIKWNSGGLIIGQVSSHFFGNISLIKSLLRQKHIIKSINKVDLFNLAKRYQDFPKYSMWGIFMNAISANATNIFVSKMFSLTAVGFYAHAYRYLGLPATVIGNAFSQVYLQKSSEQRRIHGNAKSIFVSTLLKLSIVSAVILTFGVLFVEDVFAIFFGENWRVAGSYAKILIPVFCVRFVVGSLSITFSVFEKQRESMFWNAILFVLSISIMLISFQFSFVIERFLYYYVVILSLFYLALLFRTFQISKGDL